MKKTIIAAILAILCGQSVLPNKVVYYSEYGAVGDGATDDFEAIVKAHEAANEAGLKVCADAGATYYIGATDKTAMIQTDTDWGDATFIIDDSKVTVANRNRYLFNVSSKLPSHEITTVKTLRKNQQKLDLSLSYHSFIVVTDKTTKRYIREGLNQNSGYAQTDVFVADKNGHVDMKAPILWDYDQITGMTAYPIDPDTLTVSGGHFTTIANQAESRYTYYARSIGITRSNVVVDGVYHAITGELDHGAPYNGFIYITCCTGVTVQHCKLSGHKTYVTVGAANAPVYMGSYDARVNCSTNVTFKNCKQINDIHDTTLWGIFVSDYSKNLTFDRVEFSRFDAHMGVVNATIRNSILGHQGINLIGSGVFLVENTHVMSSPGWFRFSTFINLRSDYGSTWEGEIIIRNCEYTPHNEADAALIGGSYSGKHDFGYTCYLPEKITIDGLTINDGNRKTNVSNPPYAYQGIKLFADFNREFTGEGYEEKYPYIINTDIDIRNLTVRSGMPYRISSNPFMFRNVRVSESGVTDPLKTPFDDGEIKSVPAFNSCSYYYRPADEAAFRVEYRRADANGWHQAHATVCDQPERIHKGSLFNLDEDAEYQIRILAGNQVVAQTAFRTWSSTPRIAKTIDLGTLPPTGQDGIVITEQGTPDAWIKYTAPAGWTVRRTPRDDDTQDAVIVLKGARYVILENLTVEGGKRHSIVVDDCEYVRVLNCELTGWGRTGVQQFDNPYIGGNDNNPVGHYKDAEGRWINYDGGIQIRKSFGTVVERCYIHDPRGRSNSWMFSHPTGPQALIADFTLGGNVIRWNDFVGSDEHRWNDVMEGQGNGSPDGGLFRDSEITGNYLSFGNDDGIELEGGGINLRFIGNKVEGTLCGISFGANLIGPQYAIGNLVVNLGDEEGYTGSFLKNSHGVEQKGKRFIYGNTFHGFGRSAGGYGGYGNATPVNAGLGTMRNNIFLCAPANLGEWVRAEHFDNDLFWVNRSQTESEQLVAAYRSYGQERNAFAADPHFVDPVAGNYRLAPSSVARGKAVEVAGIVRAGDDLGAYFNNAADIPLRPLALAATPSQINFEATGGHATVTLSLPADAEAPVAYQIRQNTVFDWFTVTPANGVIAPGESLKLTVAADAARLRGRPVFRGAFLVRTPNGLSRPVTVYAKGDYVEDKRPVSAGPNTVYVEAKSGAADSLVNIRKDGVYSLLVRASSNGQRGGRQAFDISNNGETVNIGLASAAWYLRTGGERVMWLYSLGQLKAGINHVKIKSDNPGLTVVEYIITDNPASFFLQERNAGR